MQTALLPSSDFIKCKVEEQKQQRRVLCLIELGVKSKVILILLTFHFRRVENREWRSQKSCSLLQTKKKRNTFASQSAEVIICMRIKGRSKAHTPSARLKKASSSRCWQHPENFSFPDGGNFSKRLRLCYALSTRSEFLAEIVSVLYVAEKRATHTAAIQKLLFSRGEARAPFFAR